MYSKEHDYTTIIVYNSKNINCSISESLERFGLVIEAAKVEGIPVRG